ncbi:hypothetical protein AAC387_Pa02g0701 [Persea americana]
MLRFSLPRAIQTRNLLLFNPQRGLHSRNKKAMELIAKGWNALNEVDRVIDYTDLNDRRLYPYFRTAKENFELALEIDNSNTHARYWLGRFHLKYQAPGTCKAVGAFLGYATNLKGFVCYDSIGHRIRVSRNDVRSPDPPPATGSTTLHILHRSSRTSKPPERGAALLVEAAEMGDPDAQYELGCRLRVENKYVQSDQQAFYYLEKAVDQGHAGAAIAYGSLLLRGAPVPEAISKFTKKRKLPTKLAGKNVDSPPEDPIVKAKEQFQIAADAGCDLGLHWLKRLADFEKQQITQ